MARAVLLRAGRALAWVPPGASTAERILLDPDPERAAAAYEAGPASFPSSVRSEIERRARSGGVAAGEPELARALGLPVAEEGELIAARGRAFPRFEPADRAFYLELARRRLDERLRDPSELLVTLAREEERFERAQRRDAEALAHFLAPAEGALGEYRRSWEGFAERVERQHGRLTEELERSARSTVPHLASVVGPRVAARLVARAGGLSALARMSAPRLQLLGARRRPGPGRSPRFGVIFRAAGMDQVAPDRQGAYARSLAAIAAIAARIDAYGQGSDRRKELTARRDRAIQRLRGRVG